MEGIFHVVGRLKEAANKDVIMDDASRTFIPSDPLESRNKSWREFNIYESNNVSWGYKDINIKKSNIWRKIFRVTTLLDTLKESFVL